MFRLRTVLIFSFIVIATYAAANWQYFFTQGKYYFKKPEAVSPQVVTEVGDDEPMAEPNHIWVSSLGITAPIVYVDEKSEQSFQVGLRSGVVHYPGTALPGQEGNTYYFGHSSDFPTAKGDFKTVFALLPKIEKGATIQVTSKEGRLYEYVVVETKVVGPNDTSVLAQDKTKHTLSLQTSYPVGTALKRFVVIANLKEQ